MIVTWVAIQSQPLPWVEHRRDVAYVACGERSGELCLVRPEGDCGCAAVARMLDSLEEAIRAERGGKPSLAWLRKAMPDQGTSIRLSPLQRCAATSYEDQVRLLAARIPVQTV